jgi:hypothetical protein
VQRGLVSNVYNNHQNSCKVNTCRIGIYLFATFSNKIGMPVAACVVEEGLMSR